MEAQLSEEEKAKLAIRKEADAIKQQGNEFYKKKEFPKALELYQQAIDKCPIEITFYSNKAAVYFEMKQFQDCLDVCDQGINAYIQGNTKIDRIKLAKTYARKANAYMQLTKYDESIEMYEKAIKENDQDKAYKQGLVAAKRARKEMFQKQFSTPESYIKDQMEKNALKYDHFETFKKLGDGNFTKVFQVEHIRFPKHFFALKICEIKKVQSMNRETDILLEKHSLNKIKDKYGDDEEMPTVKLIATFKDDLNLYFLTEMFQQKHEVWEHCRSFGIVQDDIARYTFFKIC